MELEEERRASGSPSPECWLQALTCTSSRSSIRAIGTPAWMVAITVSTAPASVSNEQAAAEIASGMPQSRSCTSVMMPSVPSEPTKSRVRSYPAADLRARPPVRTTWPSAVTTVSPSTASRMVP